jgi:hypothetical protein
LFWKQFENPKLGKAGLLGIIFALGFLTRREGILSFFFIPLLQGAPLLFGHRKHDYDLRRFVGWTAVFMLSFSLLAIPQIWRVSHNLGYFAIDEREIWTLIRNTQDGKSYDEKMMGLDFSPRQTNFNYIRAHPEIHGQLKSDVNIKETVKKYVKTMIFNLDDLYRNKLNILLGPLGLLFFFAGLFALCKFGRPWDGFLVAAFIVFNLIGPLLYQIQLRYIAVIAPLMMLVEGIGLVYLAKLTGRLWTRGRVPENTLRAIFAAVLIAVWALPVYSLFVSPKTFNGEYSPESLREPVRIIKSIAEKELLRVPVVSARKRHLMYFAGVESAALPYTDIQGLTRFCDLNGVDFLFLQYRQIKHYPFLEAFANGKPPAGVTLLHRGTDAFGERLELYRYLRKPIG